MTNPIVHFEIPVDDIEKQKKFYSEAFGWKLDDSGMSGMTYLLVSTGPQGVSVGGGMYKREESGDKVKLYVGDDDLDGAIERFKRAGGEIINTFDIPGMVKGAVGKDLEGNQIGIIKNTNPASSSGTSKTKKSSSKKKGKASKKRKSKKR